MTRTKVIFTRKLASSNRFQAYFTLFQERLKISSLQQLQAKEKEVLENKITQLEAQLEAQIKVIRNLEEKDTLTCTNLKNLESELSLRQQVSLLDYFLELA